MTNAKTTAAKLAPAAKLVLPLLLLLIPSVRTNVVVMPELVWNSIADLGHWMAATFVTVWNWIF